MAAEKLIATMNDLADAAPRCDEDVFNVTDSAEEEIVLSCLQPEGQVYGAENARTELLRRLSSRGIKCK